VQALVQKYERVRSQLEYERTSFIPQWRDIGTFIRPSRPRFFLGDGNKGDRRNLKILDTTATTSSRTLAAGMHSGITAPSRPWFKLSTPDPALGESENAKFWLYTVTERMRSVFLKSGYYNTMPIIYGDIGDFGTGVYSIEEDFEKTIHTNSFPVGTYMLGKDSKGRINTFCREFRMTVRQCVEQFGRENGKTGKVDWSNFSGYIKRMWDEGNYEQWVEIVQVIMPNDNYDPEKLASKHKKFVSVYYERGLAASTTSSMQGSYSGLSGIEDKVLSEKGYDYFPIMGPRWYVSGEDVYGTDCPGMTALGDVKQLQSLEKRILQGIDKMVNPPMQGHSSLRDKKTSMLPGGVTWVDDLTVGGMKPLHEVTLRLLEAENKQALTRQRIQKAYFEDLFLMLANLDRRDITATEINQRYEEKLLVLGPVLEQMNFDALDPTIDVVFRIMLQQGMIPPPPQELQGQELRVEYVSVMAQAQKLLGLSGIERFSSFVGRVAPMKPDIVDKISFDQMLDVYGDAASLPPGIIVPDETAQAIRDQRAQQQAQMQQAEMMKQQSSAVKDLSQSKVADDSALKRLLGA
jgi:hypothetical protein